eukprot:COSAG01_NODE_19215_length_1024_cov_0.944865_1_plen_126_part_10
MGSGPANHLTPWVDVRHAILRAGGWSALHECALHGHADVAELLLRSGADANARTKRACGRRASSLPACPPAEACFVLSRQRGAGVGVRAGDIPGGATPLHWAAQGSHQVRHLVLPRGHLTLTPCND